MVLRQTTHMSNDKIRVTTGSDPSGSESLEDMPRLMCNPACGARVAVGIGDGVDRMQVVRVLGGVVEIMELDEGSIPGLVGVFDVNNLARGGMGDGGIGHPIDERVIRQMRHVDPGFTLNGSTIIEKQFVGKLVVLEDTTRCRRQSVCCGKSRPLT